MMLTRMKRWGKIAAIGAISAYNDWDQCAFPNWMEVWGCFTCERLPG
jgi:NADPH-dependent curcumin reductase CurA